MGDLRSRATLMLTAEATRRTVRSTAEVSHHRSGRAALPTAPVENMEAEASMAARATEHQGAQLEHINKVVQPQEEVHQDKADASGEERNVNLVTGWSLNDACAYEHIHHFQKQTDEI